MYSQKLREMERQQETAITNANAIRATAHSERRELTDTENQHISAHVSMANRVGDAITAYKADNSLATLVHENGPAFLFDAGNEDAFNARDEGRSGGKPGEHPRAAAFRTKFAGWMNNALRAVGGSPQMDATAPSGPISVGSGSGLDSIAITIPTEILPYLASYYNLDSFGLAGATQFFTDHTRPLTKPIMSAGAPAAVIAENAAATTSQPFGLSGFTFGGTKYERLVLASYEALMNSELPLQGAIMDELLATLATTMTGATTTSFVAALTAASSTLATGVGGSGGSVYTSMVDLRHAVPPRFDLPTNKWMLSRATLAEIRNTRASTSGVPMFSPDGTKLFDREYVINDYLDTASGAGVGFVTFGSFADGVWLRRTPVMTRVFLELFANSGQVGFRTTQWADAHYLAELAGAAQPPSFQPIYYTNVVSES
jgi:HK97 family phage major capsid protein